jgi:aspartokinase
MQNADSSTQTKDSDDRALAVGEHLSMMITAGALNRPTTGPSHMSRTEWEWIPKAAADRSERKLPRFRSSGGGPAGQH